MPYPILGISNSGLSEELYYRHIFSPIYSFMFSIRYVYAILLQSYFLGIIQSSMTI
jgi:hypothetical protein